MKVLYDITTLAHIHCAAGVNGAGIYRHVEEMGLALARQHQLDFQVSVAKAQLPKAIRYLTETGNFGLQRLAVPSLGADPVATGALARMRSAPLSGGELAGLVEQYVAANYSPARVYDTGRFDVYHANWRGATQLPSSAHPAVVFTVPDIIPLKHPEWFVEAGQRNELAEYLAGVLESVRRNHSIIVNTESVKVDVLERFPHIVDEQVHIVPLGVSEQFTPCDDPERIAAVKAKYGIPADRRYALCVNTLEPRKNMATAIEAYGHLVADGVDDVSLVLVGSKGWLADDIEARSDLANSARASVVITGYVDDADMAALYSGASVFCYPTLDEGFGLPLLEAMRCRTPVVTSKRAPLIEVAGDAAVIVDPLDASELCAALARVLGDGELANELRSRGVIRAAEYTWDRSAQDMVTAYRQAVSRRERVISHGAGTSAPGLVSQPRGRRRTLPDVATLAELADTCRGQRVFVLGDTFDPAHRAFDALEHEYTIAVNGFYEHYDRLTWKPTMYLVTEDVVDERIISELNGLSGSMFCFPAGAAEQLRERPGVVTFELEPDGSQVVGVDLLDDTAPAVTGPGRSMAAALQIAHHLGFEEVYLVAPDVDRAWGRRAEQSGSLRRQREQVERMRSWHASYRRASEATGRRVVNLTAGALTDTYPRADAYDVLVAPALPAFGRERGAHVEETDIVAEMLSKRRGAGHVMLDVGAHRGSSTRPFAARGWTVYCFEPDPENRSHLERRVGHLDNVTIDPRAVGDHVASAVPFFTSSESSGISGLSAFRSTHERIGVVDTTTVADIVELYSIDHVDFLKIDVEGFDFSVLKGVPWDRIRPDVIECEYEDAKTLPLGHTTDDVVAFLTGRGYTVYLSEWHPVLRYGLRHQWRRVVPYPGIDVPSNSWGNLLAFRDDPGYEAIVAMFAQMVTAEGWSLDPKKTMAAAAPTEPRVQGKRRSYADAADRLRDRAPTAYRMLRRGKRLTGRVLPRRNVSTRRRFYADCADRLRDRAPVAYTLLRRSRRLGVRVVRTTLRR